MALDLEMNQPSRSIIQIGVAVGDISTGNIKESKSLIINPHEAINPYIEDLTGINQEMVDAGMSLQDAYVQIRDMHAASGSFINPLTWGGGDAEELRQQLKNSEFYSEDSWCFGRRWIDVKTLFVSWRLASGDPIQGGLAKSMTKVGLAFQGRKHDAEHDAINTFYMFNKMLKIIKRKQ